MNIAWFIEGIGGSGGAILARLENGTVIHIPSMPEYLKMQGIEGDATLPEEHDERLIKTIFVGTTEMSRYKDAAKVMGATYTY